MPPTFTLTVCIMHGFLPPQSKNPASALLAGSLCLLANEQTLVSVGRAKEEGSPKGLVIDYLTWIRVLVGNKWLIREVVSL